ncbi:AbrB/MazE/SpoVT family DNA-binding domain-containing protein [Candidatus Collierbacteria bacterium]|nr:AbrB/MazE/SpoVT family DNA-binding domain-containing protein [Candidatus Collierbacteria bacterium]
MNEQKVIKSGNSLAVTLPSRLVKSIGLRAGDLVGVSISLDQTRITYKFIQPRQLSLTPRFKK